MINVQRGFSKYGACGQYSYYYIFGDLCYVYFREDLIYSSTPWQKSILIEGVKPRISSVSLVGDNAVSTVANYGKIMTVAEGNNTRLKYICTKSTQYVGTIIFPIVT